MNLVVRAGRAVTKAWARDKVATTITGLPRKNVSGAKQRLQNASSRWQSSEPSATAKSENRLRNASVLRLKLGNDRWRLNVAATMGAASGSDHSNRSAIQLNASRCRSNASSRHRSINANYRRNASSSCNGNSSSSRRSGNSRREAAARAGSSRHKDRVTVTAKGVS